MILSKKLVVWGAGLRGRAFVDYIGSQNVIAIVDNNMDMKGKEYCSVPIIDFDTYLKEYQNFFIVITPAVCDEIEEQLKKSQVFQYFILNQGPSELQGYGVKNLLEKVPVEYDVNGCNVIYGSDLFGTLLYDFLKSKGCKDVFILLHKKFGMNRANIYKKLYNEYNLIEDIGQLQNRTGKIFATVHERVCGDKKQWVIEEAFDFSDRILEYRNSKIEALKNAEQGKRGFIVCTGPSLRMEDLDKLEEYNEVCISMNKISYAFKKTMWRPKYYICEDRKMLREFIDSIKNMDVPYKFLPDSEAQLWKEKDNIYKFHSHMLGADLAEVKFSEDLSKRIYMGYTVTYAALQVALYLGLKDIYLVGADFNYTKDTNEACNHFTKEYVSPKGQVNPFFRERCIRVYEEARRYAEAHGAKIWNATRGGKLEVFEREDFDSLF